MRTRTSERRRGLTWRIERGRAGVEAPVVGRGPAAPGGPSVPDLLHAEPRAWGDLRGAVQLVRIAYEGGDPVGGIDALVEELPLAPSGFGADPLTAQLFLDDLVRACLHVVIGGRRLMPRTAVLRRILERPPAEAADTAARQRVLAELVERPALRGDLERLYLAVCRLREALIAGGSTAPNVVRRKVEVLVALQAGVNALADGFADSGSALARLRAMGAAIRSRPEWALLTQVIDLEGNLATVDLRVRLGSDGTIRGFGVLAIRENSANVLLPGRVRRLLQRVGAFLRGYRFGEREVVVRLLDEVFAPLAGEVVALLALTGALELYLAALGFRDVARGRGLEVCLPVLAEAPAEREIGGLFNPLIFLQNVTPVPCDLPTGPHDALVVITGPNSGGKTRLLQAIALTQLLAQVGLFVPAARARLVRVPRLFLSLVPEADAAQAEGRLGAELRRIRWLFEQLEPGALAILDELCSGTNPMEGEAIFEMVVALLPDLRPQVFVSTHFLGLAARLARERPVPNLAFLQVELDAEERPTFRFVPGVATTSLAHKVAARLGVTQEALRALVDARRKAR
jgi:DNA mismatch repair protein MutS2